MPRLVGRTAIITGAGDGIGRGIASRFAREGAAVVVADYDEDAGSRCAGELNAAGAHAIFVRCDVADRTQVEAAVAAAMKRFGSADILVNNAFRGREAARFEEMDDGRFQESLVMNLFAAKWSMGAAFPHMRERRWGRIINICSLNGVNAHMGTADYNVGKEALRTLTRTAAREWARYGICANVICPAAVSASYRRFSEMQPEMAARIAAANSAALTAPELPIASVPTGMPAGICTIDNSESSPFMAFDSTGTPRTGSTVFAAAMPGR